MCTDAIGALGSFCGRLGKRLEQSHATGSNYIEVSTDVGSSWVANKLKNIIIKEFADIVVEYRCYPINLELITCFHAVLF